VVPQKTGCSGALLGAVMKAKSRGNRQANFLFPDLWDQLNPAHPLLKLAKPIRLMVGLMLLKQLENLSDERVVEAWVANPYFQAFCGETRFQWKFPCNPSNFVYFRKRIGEEGARLIFEVSVALHGDAAKEAEVTVDTTVQEKNIAFPTDTKLLTKIIKRCRKIAADEGIRLRRSFRRELPGLLLQRFKSNRIIKRIRTMAGVLIRELERKLPCEALARHRETLQLFRRVHGQKRTDKNKVYSLHEPDVLCIGKGKEHKKYEFGRKASIVVTKTTGVIVGALSFRENIYDGKTLPSALEQAWQITETCPKVAICDRGYRGRTRVGDVEIVTLRRPKKSDILAMRRQARARFRRRAGIEPVIGHLKADHRMARNFLKGVLGDTINLFMAAAAFNLKKWMRQLTLLFSFMLVWLLGEIKDDISRQAAA